MKTINRFLAILISVYTIMTFVMPVSVEVKAAQKGDFVEPHLVAASDNCRVMTKNDGPMAESLIKQYGYSRDACYGYIFRIFDINDYSTYPAGGDAYYCTGKMFSDGKNFYDSSLWIYEKYKLKVDPGSLKATDIVSVEYLVQDKKADISKEGVLEFNDPDHDEAKIHVTITYKYNGKQVKTEQVYGATADVMDTQVPRYITSIKGGAANLEFNVGTGNMFQNGADDRKYANQGYTAAELIQMFPDRVRVTSMDVRPERQIINELLDRAYIPAGGTDQERLHALSSSFAIHENEYRHTGNSDKTYIGLDTLRTKLGVCSDFAAIADILCNRTGLLSIHVRSNPRNHEWLRVGIYDDNLWTIYSYDPTNDTDANEVATQAQWDYNDIFIK